MYDMDLLSWLLRRSLQFLFPLSKTAEVVEALTDIQFGRLMNPRVTKSGCVALLPYRHSIVRAVIIEAKFHKNAKAFSLLGQVLKDYLEALNEETHQLAPHESYVLVPIPLGEKRQKEREYNQVEEVLKSVALSYDSTLLKRVRETAPQTSLSKKQRTQNLQDAFCLEQALRHDLTYIIIDDVVTTGATLASARDTLAAARAQVQTLALAY